MDRSAVVILTSRRRAAQLFTVVAVAASAWGLIDPRPYSLVMGLLILLPWLAFFTIGRPFAGIFCLVLQITLIGWLPAAIWAVYALSQYNTDKKIDAALGRR